MTVLTTTTSYSRGSWRKLPQRRRRTAANCDLCCRQRSQRCREQADNSTGVERCPALQRLREDHDRTPPLRHPPDNNSMGKICTEFLLCSSTQDVRFEMDLCSGKVNSVQILRQRKRDFHAARHAAVSVRWKEGRSCSSKTPLKCPE